MPIVIVPNRVRDEINRRLDAALAGRPCDAETREQLYSALLAYFDQHGQVPEFTLEPADGD